MLSRPHLDHRAAVRITDHLRASLEAADLGAAVAVVDDHGELIAFVRTDGCPLPSIHNAINKAFTAAREGRPSRAIGDAAREDQFPITNFGDLRYTGWGGGVPIVIDGAVVGAVGVSGLPETDDIDLAREGAALVDDDGPAA